MNPAAPTPKVISGISAGAIVTIIVYILGVFKINIPPEVATGATAVISFIVSYLTPHTTTPTS
jgi:hypothetical protein